ncbi:MAG: MFS transporter [Anaerolineae bacterium]|nr:MFS transporter [Anaerolineae bacterium]
MSQPFVRDRFTWLTYALLCCFAYLQAALGPLVPFLRAELNLNFTVSALYVSAYALGMIGAGLTGDRVARRIGRRRLFWGGGAGMALGGVLFTLGRSAPVTIAAVLFMALLGSYLLVMIQATLSDRHGPNRAYALTESNVFAVLGASIAPILVGFSEQQGWGWRLVILLGVGFWLLLAVTQWRVPVPEAARAASPTRAAPTGKLPGVFWAYWLVVFISTAVEWSMIFWSSTYMETVGGLSREAAASSVALFTAAQFIGRASGSYLTRHYPTSRLLLMAGAIVVIGFPLFWLGRTPWLNGLGLFISGLGVANLYPLALSVTSTVGIANPNAASGRTSFGSGLAILIAPQILGALADQSGIQSAYAMVAPLAIGILVVTWFANRQAGRYVQP